MGRRDQWNKKDGAVDLYVCASVYIGLVISHNVGKRVGCGVVRGIMWTSDIADTDNGVVIGNLVRVLEIQDTGWKELFFL